MLNLEELVFQALGEASMCWSERPKGVFDCANARRIGDELIKAIKYLGQETNLEGTAVKFVQQLPGQVGTTEYVAIISKVHEVHRPENYPTGSIKAACDWHEDGDVTLHVLTENTVMVRHGVPYSAEKLPGTWHHIK